MSSEVPTAPGTGLNYGTSSAAPNQSDLPLPTGNGNGNGNGDGEATPAHTLHTNDNEVVPPSVVAKGTGVPSAPVEYAEAQQASTMPGDGGVVESQSTETEKVPFKEQVNGYAKKFAGTVFGNKEEKEFGEKKLDGKI